MSPQDSPRAGHVEDARRDTQHPARKLLFLAQLPPPLHGASATTKRAFDILSSRGDLEVTHLWLGGAETLQDVGRKSLGKFFGFAHFLAILAWHFVTLRRYAIGYLTFAPISHTAIRDGLLIGMSRLLAKRTLVHMHTEGLELVLQGATPVFRLVRWLIRGSELIALTEKIATKARATGHFATVHHLPNCVEDTGTERAPRTSTLRCGYLANLDPQKGVLRFVDCIEECHRRGLPVTARIVGPSTAKLSTSELQAEVERRGLAGIIEVAGPLFGQKKADFYAETDLFIYLSQRDFCLLAEPSGLPPARVIDRIAA